MARQLRGWAPRILSMAAISACAFASTTAEIPTSTSSVILVAPNSFSDLFSAASLALPLTGGMPNGPWDTLVDAQRGLLRSSRAIYTFALNTCDYKYSLRNYEDKTPEYYGVRSEVNVRVARRLLRLCEANGGFYIKAGQFVGSLQNIPKEFASTLSVLQDHAPSQPFQAVERVLRHEFHKEVLDIYAEFDEQPIAAASLAQVHHAVLKDGQEVAVKVQYPQLQQQFQIDIKTMAVLSKAVSWLFPDYQFEWIVPEFERNISKELDFALEGRNAEQTAKNFARNKRLKIPRVHWDLTTESVLTMEFVTGIKIDDVQRLQQAGIDEQEVAELLAEIFAEMIFCHGFVHGDPHPGNILIHPLKQTRGKRNFNLVLLDHGLYRVLDEGFRADFCRLWKALILLDPDEMAEVGNRLGAGRFAKFLPVIFTGRAIGSKAGLGQGMTSEDRDELKAEVQHFTMGDVSQFMESLPRDFLTVIRTDGLLKSIIHKLGVEPRMRMIANAKYAVMGLALDHRGTPGAQSWQAQSRALYDYANLRFRLGVLELSQRVGLFYRSLAKHVRTFFRKSLGKLWKNKVVS